MTVGFANTNTAGAINGTATVNLASVALPGTGLSNTSLTPQTVNVTGGLYNLASSNAIAPINLVLHVGQGGGSVSQALSITNTAPTGLFSEGLDSSFGAYTNSGGASALTPTFFGSITNLAAGGTSTAMGATFDTTHAGLFQGSVAVNQASNGMIDGLVNTPLAPQNVGIATSVTGGVFNFATATVNNTQPIDLGSWRQGSTANTAAISVSNTGPVSPFTELLNGSFVAPPAGFTGSGSFTGLAAGSPRTPRSPSAWIPPRRVRSPATRR